MAKYTRNEVEAMLSKGIYKVTFTKVSDASLCTMICTRDFDWLNSKNIATEMEFVAPKGGTCHNKNTKVWCIERKHEGEDWEDIRAWRSFDSDCVEDIEFFSPTCDEDVIVEEV